MTKTSRFCVIIAAIYTVDYIYHLVRGESTLADWAQVKGILFIALAYLDDIRTKLGK